jgi:hypothetical protein
MQGEPPFFPALPVSPDAIAILSFCSLLLNMGYSFAIDAAGREAVHA